MRFCHSFWSAPAKYRANSDKNQGILISTWDIWFFALSVHYVKQYGHEIVLHTDTLGERLFEALPYDRIYKTLDNNPFAPFFWASGKISAQEKEPVGSAHIDGDVFLKKPLIFDKIKNSDYDVLVQKYEYDSNDHCTDTCRQGLRPYINKKFKKYNLCRQSEDSHNCGIVCFKNQELKKEYIEAYKEIAGYLSKSKKLNSNISINIHMAPDLIIEQFLLWQLTRKNNSQVNTINPTAARKTGDIKFYNEELGYEHWMGPSKFCHLPKIREELKLVNPGLYEQVNNQTKKMEKGELL